MNLLELAPMLVVLIFLAGIYWAIQNPVKVQDYLLIIKNRYTEHKEEKKHGSGKSKDQKTTTK